jgi:AcrR family transcriptional regulator
LRHFNRLRYYGLYSPELFERKAARCHDRANSIPDAALERAMQVPWSKNYQATSLDDLCNATGLSRSSLDAAFGDERSLILQIMARRVRRPSAAADVKR